MTDHSTARALVEKKSPPPLPNPPVRPGARRSPEDEALAFLRANRDTHTRWAEYFEQNPEVEKEYLATGVWEGASDQRRLERQYNAAIATFERLIQQTLTPPEGDTLSGEVVEVVARNTVPAFVSNDDDATINVGDLRLILAALQSRVSPQEGLREALEEARRFVVIHGPAAAFPDVLAKIDAALSASRMSEDAPSADSRP